jgi:hypothetical protein
MSNLFTIDDLWRLTDHARGDDPYCLEIVRKINAYPKLIEYLKYAADEHDCAGAENLLHELNENI